MLVKSVCFVSIIDKNNSAYVSDKKLPNISIGINVKILYRWGLIALCYGTAGWNANKLAVDGQKYQISQCCWVIYFISLCLVS